MRILTFTTLYPNCRQQRHGIFIQTRLRRLRAEFPVTGEVVAPVPWFPSRNERFGRYATYAAVPALEDDDGLPVHHPRYLVVPGLSWQLAPLLLYLGARGRVRERHAATPFDLIDAHYFYPDGVAAAMLARELGLPFTITARGSDITVLPRYRLPRRMINWAGRSATAMITVCQALRDELMRLGQDGARITVLRNGVDLERFRPVARTSVRERFGIGDRCMLLSVGNLVELKGHHLSIESLTLLPDAVLVLVGDGPERDRLQALATRLGVSERVRFVGTVAQDELAHFYSAADVMVLASRSEGWANVLLEAMACGCPAVASQVWGTPEVVAAPAAGRLMAARTPAALAEAVTALLADYPGREATRAYAEGFDWSETSHGQYELFSRLVARAS